MTPAVYEPAIPAIQGPQNHAWDFAAIGIGPSDYQASPGRPIAISSLDLLDGNVKWCIMYSLRRGSPP